MDIFRTARRTGPARRANVPALGGFRQKTSTMMKKLLFIAALASLVLIDGCAKGGSGPCVVNCPGLVVTGTSNGLSPIGTVGLNLPISFSEAPNQYATPQLVNWNITGTSCTNPTDSSNPCGYFTSTTTTTASYQGPSSVPTDSRTSISSPHRNRTAVFGHAVLEDHSGHCVRESRFLRMWVRA